MTNKHQYVELPVSGDKFVCQVCGMALTITVDCKCDDPESVRFQCCEQEMKKS